MASLLQIRRSLNTAVPSSLANGELAFTANGDVLYIGSNAAVVAIGGKRFPGTLTANQALVANATGYLNEIKTANLTVTTILANSAAGSNGQVLGANATGGAYWFTPAPSVVGANTYVQFNDDGAANAVAGLTFTKTTNTLFVGNVVTVGTGSGTNTSIADGTITIGTATVNATTISIGTGLFDNATVNNFVLNNGISIGNSTVNTTANSTTVSTTSGIFSANVAVGNVFVGTDTVVVGNSTVNTVANSSVLATGAGEFRTSANVGSNVSLSTSALSIGNSTVNTVANSSTLSTDSGLFKTAANVGSNVSVTTSGLFVGNSTVNSIVNSSVITIGSGVFSTSANVGANVSLSDSSLAIGNSTVNTVANSSALATGVGVFRTSANVGSNVSLSTTGISIGNSTVNTAANSTTLTTESGIFTANVDVGNVLISTDTVTVGNSTVNAIVNSSVITIGSGSFGSSANVGSNVSLSTSSLTIGNSTVNAVVNSSSITIDSANVQTASIANAIITKIYANGAHGSNGQVLQTNSTGGMFWSAPVTNLDGLTDVEITSLTTAQFLIAQANNQFINQSISGDINIAANGFATIQANSVALGTDTTGNYVESIFSGNGLSGNASSESANLSLAVVAGNGIASNATGVHVVAGTGVTSNATGVHIGQAVGTTDNVTFNDVTINGNTVLGSSSADVVSFKGFVNTHIIPAANITYSLGNNTQRFYEVHAQNTHSEYVYVDKDMEISGNLTVSGSLVTINVSTLSVTDSLIQLASNNTTSDTLDIGFFGSYQVSGGAHEHTGLFRDASTDTFKLFKGLQTPPTTTVDTADPTYQKGYLEAYFDSGAFVANSSAVSITANNTVAVTITANSITLATPLSGNSGGTGLNSYTTEDILVANSSNGFRKLSAGANGEVLQIVGGAVAYGTLDGGTF